MARFPTCKCDNIRYVVTLFGFDEKYEKWADKFRFKSDVNACVVEVFRAHQEWDEDTIGTWDFITMMRMLRNCKHLGDKPKEGTTEVVKKCVKLLGAAFEVPPERIRGNAKARILAVVRLFRRV